MREWTHEPAGEPPSPVGARTVDELGNRLRALQCWAGVSYREIHRRVLTARRKRGVPELPAYNTVYRCLQPQRCRLDVELVVDIAGALLADESQVAEWRQAHQVVIGRTADAAIVSVVDSIRDDSGPFGGRATELAELLAAVAAGTTLLVIEGMPGVGKTRLAHHLAHRLLDHGLVAGCGNELRLSVDLRGFDPERPPADPGAVLDGFLRRLGVPGRQVHGLDLAGRIRKYRGLMADRKAIVVLDNAVSAEQVRPLLAPGTNCITVVTSRCRLAELPTARKLRLEVFGPDESVELLRTAVGPDVIDQDLPTAGRIAALVGHLPLALAVVAGQIADTPGWTLPDHLERLEEHRDRLRLEDGVGPALSSSYEALPPHQRELLRLLALHPGHDFDPCAVAALAGHGPGEVEPHLDGLVQANLVQPGAPGRYVLHDLVRVFAGQRARDEDPARARRAALSRLFDHYRAAAAAAMARYAPYEADWRPPVPAGVAAFRSREDAVEWLETEWANLIACGLYAAEHGWPEHIADLSAALYRYLDDTGRYTDGEHFHEAAARVAQGAARGRTLSSLGVACWRLGQFERARESYGEALRIASSEGTRREELRALINLGLVQERSGAYEQALTGYWAAVGIAVEIGSTVAHAHALHNIAHLDERLGRYDDTLVHVEECLGILRGCGDRTTEGRALNTRGLVRARLGHGEQAMADGFAALTIAREVGNRAGEGYARITLGRVRPGLTQARRDQELALSIAREVGNRDCEAVALNDLSRTLCRAGEPWVALQRHRTALAIATELGDPYERARSHEGASLALQALGRPAEARSQLGLALNLYRDLGTPEAAEVAARLSVLVSPGG